MGLVILRCVFLLVAAGVSISLANSGLIQVDQYWKVGGVVGGVMSIALLVLTLDMFVRKKRLDAITAVYFGMVVGLFLTYILGLALVLVIPNNENLRNHLQLTLGLVVCYVCISLLMQTRNDFRFIIPYVEFVKEVKGLKPCILDTSVVIDGRIADVIETHVLDGQIVMPKFVIAELQNIADTPTGFGAAAAGGGLDILNRLRSNADIELVIYDHDLPDLTDPSVDLKLVALAKHMQGKLITNDYNLNKVARLQGITVINLNDLANALKPVFLPGEHIEVRIVKVGEEPGQGVGYLEDGTMVVVEAGRDHVNQVVPIAVTSVLQTSAGRMVFGKLENGR